MILLVSAVFPPEPVISARISFSLAQELSDSASLVVVVCPRPTRPYGISFPETMPEEKAFKRITVKSYTHSGSSFFGRMIESVSLGISTSKQICKHKSEVSVVYANTWPLFAQYAVVRTCKKLNIPVALHIQDVYPETLTDRLGFIGPLIKTILMPIDKYVLKHSDRIVAIGHKMAEYLYSTRGIDENKISVVYNWQDEEQFESSGTTNKPCSRFTFMYLGSLSPTANLEAVIDAYGQSALKNSRLVIAGSGTSKVFCLKTASVYPDMDIEFIDAPAAKVPEILATADVLILPLKKGAGRYSIPSKLAGYMFSSRPVLAFIDPGCDAADIIKKAGCGWIVPAGEVALLTSKMREIQTFAADELAALGRSGREYAMNNLSRKVNLEKLVKLIKNSTR